jgi:hypothetical protein
VFNFSVYPEGGNGEIGNVASPKHDAVVDALNQLRGAKSFNVHLFTAWSWYNEADLDAKINRFASAGFTITLTIKYSPPAGHDGDVAGYAAFVQHVVERYGSNLGVTQFVIGNEPNVTGGNPDASDGPFQNVDQAITQGVTVARSSLNRMRSGAQVGINIAILDRDVDAAYISRLAAQGGSSFVQSVAFIGINVYPGLWPVGTGDAYADMVTHLTNTRAGMTKAGFGSTVALQVLENGYPTLDESLQASRLSAMVQAVCDARTQAGVSSYSWFGLFDADSKSQNPYAHYGLLRTDLTAKPSFDAYRAAILKGCS